VSADARFFPAASAPSPQDVKTEIGRASPLARRARLVAVARAVGRSRMVHFVAGGALLFALVPRPEDTRRIDIFSAELVASREAEAGRPRTRGFSGANLDPAEADARAIEDEMLYREALRLGLDRADGTLRQHLITKTLLFAEDVGGASRAPTDADLRAYFEAHRDRYRVHPEVHFLHVFSARAEAMNELHAQVLAADARSPSTPPAVGDPFPSVRDVTSTEEGVAGVFGTELARAAFAQPIGAWGAPVQSKLGWHFLKVLSRDGGRPATFEDVRARLPLDWSVDQRHEAVAAFLDRARTRYRVFRDGEPVTRWKPSGRLGRRADPSAED
jgi:hypothetical protein